MTLPATQAHRDVLQTASSEAASLMDVIARASRDTTVDVAKFERLMAMYERIEARKAEEAFNEAMAKTQEEMRPLARDATGDKGKYASYAALDNALRPIYTKNDLSLSFNTAASVHENSVRVLCYVTRGGYTREYSIDMPADGKGPRGNDVMTRTHATGSAVTYGMRYLLKMIFNVAVEQDDDGKAAGRTRPAPPRLTTESQFITPAQVAELRALLDNSPQREAMFRKHDLDGAPLEDISPKAFEHCKAIILSVNARRARHAAQKPGEPFQPQGAPSLPPKPQTAPVSDYAAELGYDPDTGDVTATPRPTKRPSPPRPERLSSPASTAVQHGPIQSIGASVVHNVDASPDLDWMELANTLIEEAPDFSTASLPALMKWQSQLFELMPDKETAAETHYEHIRERMRDIRHPASADALQGAWNLLMKRFD